MTVVDKGKYGYISLGLAADGFPIARAQPGWRKASIGYHGDDGDLYSGTTF
jgi:Ran-binding protein 9/10